MSHNIAVLVEPSLREQLFTSDHLARLNVLGSVIECETDAAPTAEQAKPLIADAEIVINSWRTPVFDTDLLDAAPKLKLIVYAAGSVKTFASDELWQRGVRVTSAAWAIAYQVAEFTTGMIIASLRNTFACNNAMHANEKARELPRKHTYGCTIGIVSLGQVGSKVAAYLKPLGVNLLVFDPFITEAEAVELGVRQVDLDTLLKESDVVTLHAPKLPETDHMISKPQLKLMKDGAILINTARGSLINEPDLIAELETGRITACLDVTDPEPPASDSRLRQLSNCILTPHIAGGRTFRIGEQCVEEVRRYIENEPQLFEVKKEMLANMA